MKHKGIKAVVSLNKKENTAVRKARFPKEKN